MLITISIPTKQIKSTVTKINRHRVISIKIKIYATNNLINVELTKSR